MENLLKILHLEDTPADAELIARELKKAQLNCQIFVVSDRAGFIRALGDFSPDIILSDHSLPSMDSFEALKLVKKSGIGVPFILVTATLSDELAVSAIKKGAYDYVLKDRLQRLPSAIINSVEVFRLEAEKKEAYEHLVQNERRYRNFFENNPAPMWIIDLNTFRFLDVNHMATLQYGYSRTEFLSMTALDIRPQEDVEYFKQSDHSFDAKANEYNRGIWRHLKKNGTIIYVEVFTHNVIFEGVRARFVLANDITERKKAEESLLQSEKKLKEAESIARLGNWEVDMIHGSEFWSDEMYNIFGVNRKKTTPSVELFLSLIHPDDFEDVNRKVKLAFKKFWNSSFEFRFLANGAVRYGYSKWNFVFDKEKRPVRLFGIVQDITERKVAEMERITMINDLTQRNKALEQFAYIVSHNLRAPVANILGATNLMTDPELTAEEKEVLNQGLNKSVAALDNVIKDLNDILQVKLGTNQVKEKVSFSQLVREVEISIRNLTERDNIEIRCDFTAVDEFLTLRSYLYSIFYNLISNSVKYSRQDAPCVIDIKSFRSKNKIELVFRDNGMGIDLEQNGDQVFGLYKRFHPNIEGKGIGLFMVKTQVETLGGRISIASEVNKGTEFKIEFMNE